jgi:nucleoside-diphosphate-sugar epimerase
LEGHLKYKGKSVFVTGASGFLGQSLVECLLEQDAKVSVLLRPGSEEIVSFKDDVRHFIGDLSDKEVLQKALRQGKPDYVFHLAAFGVDQPFGDFEAYIRTNILGTANLLEVASKLPLEKFIYVGTCGDEIDSPYGWSKLCARQLAMLFSKNENLPLVVARPFQVYGHRQSQKHIISHILKNAMSGSPIRMTLGEQKRDFIFVSDLIDGLLLCGSVEDCTNEVVDLGTGVGTSIRDIATKIVSLTDSNSKLEFGAIPYRKGENMNLTADLKNAKRLLNWNSNIDLNAGLKKIIAFKKKEFIA